MSDGTRLAYQVSGPRDAPALLLLPGQANSHHWWDGVRAELAACFRTVTFDYRGTGATGSDDSGEIAWSTSLFADDAIALLDELGVGCVHLYGTSMGGRVAQMLAGRYPDRVERLVLACTSPGGPHARERDRDVRLRLGARDPAARRATLLELMYTPGWLAAPPRPSTLLGDKLISPAAARLHLRASDGHDATAVLPRITASTLILHGRDDRMVPAGNARILAEAIPDATVQLMEGRHGFFDEFPAVTAQVMDFLRDGTLCRHYEVG